MGDSADRPEWGSDAIATTLRETGVAYMALTPGSSFRGLHDSIVNHLGNQGPEIMLCLHEEHAVAIAHGYAKVAAEPMAVALHSNVGLMHASMAIFNAYCDRVPMLIIGANGPADAARRRPWIDWLHSATDMGALVRPYVKWDDNPMSVEASMYSVARAYQVCRSEPTAPVYVCLDVSSQEERMATQPAGPRPGRYQPFPTPAPSGDGLERVAAALARARRPVILMGRVGGGEEEWAARVEFAERLAAPVVTHKRLRAAFPSHHVLHRGPVSVGLTDEVASLIRDADVVLSLEWLDLGGTLRAAFGNGAPTATVAATSLEPYLLSGWTKLDFSLPPVDEPLTGRADDIVRALLEQFRGRPPRADQGGCPRRTREVPSASASVGETGRMLVRHVQEVLRAEIGSGLVSLLRVPFAWDFSRWPLDGPLDYLGSDGGGGVGSGPGMAVGSALALKGSGRLPVAVLGDGDYLMGLTALWTAARCRIPLLVIVTNNGSYLNDETHQVQIARERDRPVENATVGIRLDEPEPDLATLATGQGVTGFGPVTETAALEDVLRSALDLVRSGGCAVVDVRVEAEV